MTDLYRMIDELHEAVEPLRQEVLFRRSPFLRMAAGINKMAEHYRYFSINLTKALDGVPIGDTVEVLTGGEPPALYKILLGGTEKNWLVEVQ